MRHPLHWLTELRFCWADVAIVAVVWILVDSTVTWAHWPEFIIWFAVGIAAAASQDVTRRWRRRVQVRPGAEA